MAREGTRLSIRPAAFYDVKELARFVWTDLCTSNRVPQYFVAGIDSGEICFDPTVMRKVNPIVDAEIILTLTQPSSETRSTPATERDANCRKEPADGNYRLSSARL
jgi:hypothetical protein